MFKNISNVFLFILLFSLLLCAPALSLETVNVNQSTQHYPLGLNLEYLEDPGGMLSIRDIVSDQYSDKFQKSDSPAPNFGFSESVYWLKFKLNFNLPSSKLKWVLVQKYPFIDSITLYVPDGMGDYTVKLTGRNFPFTKRDIKHRMPNFIMPVSVASADREITCYMRYSTESSIVIPLQLYSYDAFIKLDHEYQIGLGVFYGMLLLIALYSLFLYFFLSDRNYLYYFLFIFSFSLWVMNLNGTSYEYLWPELVWWNKKSFTIVGGLCLFGIIKLTQAFLSTKENTPRLDNILSIFSYGCLALMVLTVFLPYARNVRLLILITLTLLPILIITSIYYVVKGFHQAYFYLASWIMLFVGAIVSSMKTAGFIPHTFLTNNAIQIGFVFQAFFIALALTERFKIAESEKDDAKAEAAQSLKKADFVRHEMIGILEARVKERTQKLQEAMNEVSRQKEILETVASTDPLTGINNRRYFYEHAVIEFDRCKRHGQPLSIIMIDIDHFKGINDSHGHKVGDQVLIDMTADFSERMRGSDVFARFGGEEFIVLLPQTDLKASMILAERLRLAAMDLPIKDVTKGRKSFTVSIGVSEMTAKDNDFDKVIQRADDALYTAKQTGRNRVYNG
ncbi:MAG: sensor domain-containing diguanylate cyclase [Desulfobacterales bacterium]|nr:sensor domain-containing diguanylate cyclase [Desulfobacterales bacterium]